MSWEEVGVVTGAEAPTEQQARSALPAVPSGGVLVRLHPTTFVSAPTEPRQLLIVGVTVTGLVVAVPFLVAVTSSLHLAGWFSVFLGVAGAYGVRRVSNLGARTLGRNVAALAAPDSDDGALARIERLAAGPWRAEPVAVDAWGHTALARLERGDLEGALDRTHSIVALSAMQHRRRTPTVGFFGEAVVAIVGRLFPETGIAVTRERCFRLQEKVAHRMAPGLDLLVTAVRALEAANHRDAGSVLRTFNELPAELGRRYPTTTFLVQAACARVEPSLGSGLSDAWRRLGPDQQALVIRRYPEFRTVRDLAYRDQAPAPEPAALAVFSAPGALRAVEPSPSPSAWLPIVPRSASSYNLAFLVVSAALTIAWGTHLPGLVFAALWGLMAGSRAYHRRRRLQPLRAAGIASQVRLSELRRMRARLAPRGSDLAIHYPLDHGELMLIVGLHRAERALESGDVDEAREQIGWWLAGARGPSIVRLDAKALGASLIRVAALLGMLDVADALYSRFLPGSRESNRRKRSGHGDAPRALALARALLCTCRGDWPAAAQELDKAGRDRPVHLDSFERSLYGEVVRRVQAEGHAIADEIAPLTAEPHPAWLERILP